MIEAPAPEMDLALDDYLERDGAGLPALLTLEVPFSLTVRVNGRGGEVTVDSLVFHRPVAEDLDILGRLAADQGNAFKHMREFIARVVSVPDHAEITVTERILATRLAVEDFYRAWEGASAFLPKPKRPAGQP